MLGLLTLGNSPRSDLEIPFQSLVPDIHRKLVGALDGLRKEEIEALSKESGCYPLYVKTSAGPVTIQREALLRLLSLKAEKLAEEGAEFLVLLCSGDFEPFASPVPVLRPGALVEGAARSVSKSGKVGIVVPTPAQIEAATSRWRKQGLQPSVISVDPQKADAAEITEAFRDTEIEQVVLDCVGYTAELRRDVAAQMSMNVWLPLYLAARAASDYLVARNLPYVHE